MRENGITRFNIRVYMICLCGEDEILLCSETIQGMRITKFPGGGLEFGEGITECLHREAKEELGQEVEVVRHFYTTDFFQRSAYRPEDQIISVYYLVRPANGMRSFILRSPEANLAFSRVKISDLQESDVSLPIDKVVVLLLKQGLD